jgi:diguanylate cyclase (GGDEF)-like protein
MDDLEYDTDDEIGALCKSFNIVKNNLAQASELKKENEAALRKLQNEEANKMKFVKQLYNEKREKETISSEAKRDGLTGLYNRRSFDSLIEDFVANKPNDTEGALFLIDMDYFKNVNDTLGHLAGDEVLKTLAGAMRMVFPAGYLGRYGGDEFIAFVTGVTSEEDLDRFGKELCKKMDREYESGGKSVKISVSVGISGTEGIDDYSELYMKADKALYHSKENGRNQYTIASKLPD